MVSRTRRELLQFATLGLGATLTGCLDTTSTANTPTSTAMTPTSNPKTYVPGSWHPDPVQGTADPVETSESIRDEVTYHPDREEVEIDDGEFRPVDEWLSVECPYVAGRHVSALLDERLSNTKNIDGANLNRRLFDNKAVLEVRRTVEFDRYGDVVSAPEVTFEALRDSTPRSVTATAILDDYEHTCEYPVYTRDVKSQLD